MRYWLFSLFFFSNMLYLRYNVLSLVGDVMELEFSSQEELYQRVQPALKAKLAELHRLGYPYIQVIDIWNYLIYSKWTKAKDLTLSDIVSDILHVDNRRLDEYLKGKLAKTRRSQDDIETI